MKINWEIEGCFDTYREDLILFSLKRLKDEASINDCIDFIWKNTNNDEKLDLDWRFFTHLNKLPAKMKKKGLIVDTKKKKAGKYRMEKIWRIK